MMSGNKISETTINDNAAYNKSMDVGKDSDVVSSVKSGDIVG